MAPWWSPKSGKLWSKQKWGLKQQHLGPMQRNHWNMNEYDQRILLLPSTHGYHADWGIGTLHRRSVVQPSHQPSFEWNIHNGQIKSKIIFLNKCTVEPKAIMAENQSRTALWQNCKATNSFTLVSGLGLGCHTQPLRLPHQEADSLARPKSKMERQKENFQWKQLPAKPLLGVRCVYIDGAMMTISAAFGVVCPDLKISNVFLPGDVRRTTQMRTEAWPCPWKWYPCKTKEPHWKQCGIDRFFLGWFHINCWYKVI